MVRHSRLGRVFVCEFCGTQFSRAGILGKRVQRFCGNACAMRARRASGVICTTKHGRYTLPEYRVWVGMRSRCRNPKNTHYGFYGGRGISVCDHWESFENFFRDVGSRPSARHELDRINTLGNYEPGNVRWVTHKENQRNLRNARMATINGRTQCVGAWLEELGVHHDLVWGRIKNGWSPEMALTCPKRSSGA